MREKLKELIVNYVDVDPDSITDDTRFMEDMGFTSFDFMSMLGELESDLGISVDVNKASGIRSFKEAVDYLEEIK